MTPEEYISLFEKCADQNCTPAEHKLLEEYEDGFRFDDGEWNPAMGNREQIMLAIYNRLKQVVNVRPPKKTISLWYWVAAACVILTLSFGVLFFKNTQAVQELAKNKPLLNKNSIVPGSNKAILTLADGSKVVLDNSSHGTLTRQGQTTINKLNNGKLVYSADNKLPQNAMLYNTASTPNGGQYEVVLSDGTKVWLNAASSIKYPVAFSGKERRIELNGEAYFEVAKNKKMPFIVTANGTSVEVLGTHFNVMAYNNESSIVTTLLEGSVKLKNNNLTAMLKPGEQGVLGNGKSLFEVSEANTDEAIAWKNGYFIFDNENIQSIMRKVERWYDVDVRFEGKINDQDFGGTVSRFSDVNKLLKILETTGTIHFKTEGRTITVTN